MQPLPPGACARLRSVYRQSIEQNRNTPITPVSHPVPWQVTTPASRSSFWQPPGDAAAFHRLEAGVSFARCLELLLHDETPPSRSHGLHTICSPVDAIQRYRSHPYFPTAVCEGYPRTNGDSDTNAVLDPEE
ncbi:hypothetical protein D3C78_852910 [compost metagenome]